jgi:phosphomannomutase
VLAGKGDKNLEAAMWGGGHLLGSEPIGNVIINDGHHTAADAVYTALALSRVLVHHRPVSFAEMVTPLCKWPQKTVTLDLHASPALERAVQEEARRRQAELGDGGRVLCWGATTEPGRFRIMVEGNCESTPGEVSQITDDICRAIQTLAGNLDKDTPEGLSA